MQPARSRLHHQLSLSSSPASLDSSPWSAIFRSWFSCHLSLGFFTMLTVLLSTIDLLAKWVSRWLFFPSVQIMFYGSLWGNSWFHYSSGCRLGTEILLVSIVMAGRSKTMLKLIWSLVMPSSLWHQHQTGCTFAMRTLWPTCFGGIPIFLDPSKS